MMARHFRLLCRLCVLGCLLAISHPTATLDNEEYDPAIKDLVSLINNNGSGTARGLRCRPVEAGYGQVRCCLNKKSIKCIPGAIIAGTQKSGSTALAGFLAAHPKVNFHPKKEVHYFDKTNVYQMGLKEYLKGFDPWNYSNPNTYQPPLYMEASPYYISSRQACARMKKDIPNVKLIILMREPVARAHSEYRMKERRVEQQEDFKQLAIANEDAMYRCLRFGYNGDTKKLKNCLPEAITSHNHYSKFIKAIELIKKEKGWLDVHKTCFDDMKEELRVVENKKKTSANAGRSLTDKETVVEADGGSEIDLGMPSEQPKRKDEIEEEKSSSSSSGSSKKKSTKSNTASVTTLSKRRRKLLTSKKKKERQLKSESESETTYESLDASTHIDEKPRRQPQSYDSGRAVAVSESEVEATQEDIEPVYGNENEGEPLDGSENEDDDIEISKDSESEDDDDGDRTTVDPEEEEQEEERGESRKTERDSRGDGDEGRQVEEEIDIITEADLESPYEAHQRLLLEIEQELHMGKSAVGAMNRVTMGLSRASDWFAGSYLKAVKAPTGSFEQGRYGTPPVMNATSGAGASPSASASSSSSWALSRTDLRRVLAEMPAFNSSLPPVGPASLKKKYFQPERCMGKYGKERLNSIEVGLLQEARDFTKCGMLPAPGSARKISLAHLDRAVDKCVKMKMGISMNYIYRSIYVAQLFHCFKKFPRNQVLMLPSERLQREPEKTLEKIMRFIGISEDTDKDKDKTHAQMDAAHVQELVKGYFPNFEKATGWRAEGDYDPLPEAAQSELRAFFKPFNAMLFEYLEIDPYPEWES